MARIKGTAVLPIVKTLRVNRTGALAILPLTLRMYLEDRIIVFGWYPEEDFLALVRAASELVPMEKSDFYDFVGRTSARTDLTGIYANLLRSGDPLAMLRAGIQAYRSYHDTGRILVTPEGEDRALVDLVDYELGSEEMCAINTAWIDEECRMAGARETETIHTRCTRRGDSFCRWEVKWGGVEAPE